MGKKDRKPKGPQKIKIVLKPRKKDSPKSASDTVRVTIQGDKKSKTEIEVKNTFGKEHQEIDVRSEVNAELKEVNKKLDQQQEPVPDPDTAKLERLTEYAKIREAAEREKKRKLEDAVHDLRMERLVVLARWALRIFG